MKGDHGSRAKSAAGRLGARTEASALRRDESPRIHDKAFCCRAVDSPTTRSVLLTLSRPRLLELGQALAITVPPGGTREQQADALLHAATLRFRELLVSLGRDEPKAAAACRAHGLDDVSRARPQLAARLLQAHGSTERARRRRRSSSRTRRPATPRARATSSPFVNIRILTDADLGTKICVGLFLERALL